MAAHALLIGVTKFSDPLLGGLRAPRSDVEALQSVLADKERGGFDVVISIDEEFVAIRRKLSQLLDDREPTDMVLLYYSGHGIVAKGNSFFLATTVTNSLMPRAESLSASEIRQMMEESRAGRVVVVLDCCHSGIFTEGNKASIANAKAVSDRTFDPGEGAEGHYVLTATNAIQYALDAQNADSEMVPASPSLSHFTSWLVDGLGRGEAAPDKLHITLDDLYRYLCRRAREAGTSMTPQRYVKRNSGDMVIVRNPTAEQPCISSALLERFNSADWSVRREAVTELRKLVSKWPELRNEARMLLRDRISGERDRDVCEAMVAALAEGPSHATVLDAFDMTERPGTVSDDAVPAKAEGEAASRRAKAAVVATNSEADNELGRSTHVGSAAEDTYEAVPARLHRVFGLFVRSEHPSDWHRGRAGRENANRAIGVALILALSLFAAVLWVAVPIQITWLLAGLVTVLGIGVLVATRHWPTTPEGPVNSRWYFDFEPFRFRCACALLIGAGILAVLLADFRSESAGRTTATSEPVATADPAAAASDANAAASAASAAASDAASAAGAASDAAASSAEPSGGRK